MCVFDAACCSVSACVCLRAFGCSDCVRALPCFVCVGRLIICCGESAEGRSKARSQSPRGKECCGICWQKQKKNQQRGCKCNNATGEEEEKSEKITLDVQKGRVRKSHPETVKVGAERVGSHKKISSRSQQSYAPL